MKTKPQTDRQQYLHLSHLLRGLMLLDLHGTEYFREVWGKMEEIKNRHGGNPPRAEWPAMPHLKPTTTLFPTVWL